MIAPAGIASLSPGATVPFDEVELKKLRAKIEEELEEALDEHQELEDRLNEWQRAYEGEPRQKRRTFPWPGACNLEVPLIGFTTDSIVARILNTIFSMEPFWTVRPLRKEVDTVAKPTEHYLDWSRKAEYNLYSQIKPCVIQTTKFGWGWLKYGWENYTRRDYSLDANGEVQLLDEIVRRPVVYHVRNQDIIIQAGVENEHMAEWITHRVRLTDNQMLMRKYYGIYDNVDEVIKKKDDDRNDREYLEGQHDKPFLRRQRLNQLYEFQICYPFGSDGVPVDMVVTWHHPTKSILRIVFNPYPWRPFTKLTFIELEGRLEGFGIARRLWQIQEELSTIHRQQVDNATVANTRFFLGKRGSVRPGTQIWPGRFLTVNDPKNDINVVQLGDIYPSMGSLETRSLSYAERASGISDPQLGRESQVAGGRATATGTLAMIQEGNRRFDLNVRDIRESLSIVGRRILELNQRFRPKGAAYFVEGEQGALVEKVLDLPPEFSASKLAIELTASTATINRETEKQSLIGLLGILKQYGDGIIQGAMALANPQVPPQLKETIVRVAEANKHIMDRIVQDFDIRDVDKVVPSLLIHEAMQEQMNGSNGGPGGSTGGGNDPRMAALLRMGGGSDPNGPRGAGGIGDMGPVP